MTNISDTTSNPVIVYVKMMMVLFLMVVHLKSTFYNEKSNSSSNSASNYVKYKLVVVKSLQRVIVLARIL